MHRDNREGCRRGGPWRLRLKWAALVAGEWGDGEAVGKAKMGCLTHKGARGGHGVAGEALWRPRGGERRPAMEVTRCGDAGEGGVGN